MTADGRSISYLRLSITDRCNLRCIYCMPPGGVRRLTQADILSYDEIVRILSAVSEPLGLRSIRITGGEPLVRGGVIDLVRRIADLPRIRDISMTTNALLLEGVAEELKEAGLHRVNISLDTLRPERFQAICRGGVSRRSSGG
jgi:cyclic pyranopterin phosphate synthase